MSQYLVRPEDVDRQSASATLRGEEAHHLIRVARVRTGETVRLFDGAGGRWSGELSGSDPERALITGLVKEPSNEPDRPVRLLAGLLKGDRWEWLLEKAVELGATRITPLLTLHTVARAPEGPSRLARWEKIVTAAAKQCERGVIPALDPPSPLASALEELGPQSTGETRLVYMERSEGAQASTAGGALTLAVGPEGGFAEEELAAFRRAGFLSASLGGRILRAETAALAALARTLQGV